MGISRLVVVAISALGVHSGSRSPLSWLPFPTMVPPPPTNGPAPDAAEATARANDIKTCQKFRDIFSGIKATQPKGTPFLSALEELLGDDRSLRVPNLFLRSKEEYSHSVDLAKTVCPGTHGNSSANLKWEIYYRALYIDMHNQLILANNKINSGRSKYKANLKKNEDIIRGLKFDASKDTDLANSRAFMVRANEVLCSPEKNRELLFTFGFPSQKVRHFFPSDFKQHYLATQPFCYLTSSFLL